MGAGGGGVSGGMCLHCQFEIIEIDYCNGRKILSNFENILDFSFRLKIKIYDFYTNCEVKSPDVWISLSWCLKLCQNLIMFFRNPTSPSKSTRFKDAPFKSNFWFGYIHELSTLTSKGERGVSQMSAIQHISLCSKRVNEGGSQKSSKSWQRSLWMSPFSLN